MRQFSPEEEMPALLAANSIDRNDMAALADTLSAFHARAPAAPWQGHSVHTNRLLDAVIANSGELIEQLQQVAPDIHLGSLRHWLVERIERHQPLFEERERNGYVRECHGDLHLANIVRYEGRLMPFDRLEFDASLRWIDVIDDIAFLIMDLVGHESSDLAFALLSRYLESSGDYGGMRLLPFYAVHRALVRAKVDALSIATIPRRADEFRGRLNRRLRSAVEWRQPQTPALILMHGVSGSGKSWLSERLIPRIPALRVRSDVERKRMAGVSTHQPSTASVRDTIYTEQFTRMTYARLSECAEHCLTSGFSVIVDATFLESASRELFSALARRLGIPCVIVACQAPAAALRERIVTRAAHGERTSDADLAVLERQLGHAPFEASERGDIISADTSVPGTVDRVARIIRERAALTSVAAD